MSKPSVALKVLLGVFLIGLTGCRSSMMRREMTRVDSARLWASRSASLAVEWAGTAEDRLYLKYRGVLADSDASPVFYAMAGAFPKDKVEKIPLVVLPPKIWNNQTTGLKQDVTVLYREDWRIVQQRIQARIVPKDKNKGIVVHQADEEFLLYYDEQGRPRMTEKARRPEGVGVQAVYASRDLAGVIARVLRAYLAEKGLLAQKVLFVTAEQGRPNDPFFYVDLGRGIAVELNLPAAADIEEGILRKGLKSVDYLIFKSHVLGLVARPVSSLLRLIAWTGDTTYDMITPDFLMKLTGNPREIPPVANGPGMDLDQWEDDLDKLTGTRRVDGRIRFLIDGEAFFPRLTRAITNARTSIWVRTFIFDNDDYAVKIAELLKAKSRKEGMDARVLLDGMGVLMGESKTPPDLPEDFVPPASMPRYLQKNSRIKVRVRPNAWLKADHVKTTIIDQTLCFTGGMNIGREYRYNWHDLMMEVTGPVVKEIVKDFTEAWAYASAWGDVGYLVSRWPVKAPYADSPAKDGVYPLRLLYTRLNDPQIYRAQLAAIRRAKKYIYISNAYFSDNTILEELIKARRRGVDVRVILPVHGNHDIMNASNIITANVMFRNGIRVFFYPGMSHIKAAVYDGWLCTGSANFDNLSLRDNIEMNIATSHPPVVKDLLQRLFDKDFRVSHEMTRPLKSGIKDFLAEVLADRL